jgi:hypothetical protein
MRVKALKSLTARLNHESDARAAPAVDIPATRNCNARLDDPALRVADLAVKPPLW